MEQGCPLPSRDDCALLSSAHQLGPQLHQPGRAGAQLSPEPGRPAAPLHDQVHRAQQLYLQPPPQLRAPGGEAWRQVGGGGPRLGGLGNVTGGLEEGDEDVPEARTEAMGRASKGHRHTPQGPRQEKDSVMHHTCVILPEISPLISALAHTLRTQLMPPPLGSLPVLFLWAPASLSSWNRT